MVDTHRSLGLVFAKEPRPGRAKTRLAAAIGDQAACALAEAFLRDTLDTVRAAGLELAIAFDPADARGWFERLAPDAQLIPQCSGDLGARMGEAISVALDGTTRRVLALGMDSPHVAPADLTDAVDALDTSDVCIGPATDGGYWLLGQSASHGALFESIPWSTERVLETTLAQAKSARLTVAKAATAFDVDQVEDLERLQSLLCAEPARAPRTWAVLEELA